MTIRFFQIFLIFLIFPLFHLSAAPKSTSSKVTAVSSLQQLGAKTYCLRVEKRNVEGRSWLPARLSRGSLTPIKGKNRKALISRCEDIYGETPQAECPSNPVPTSFIIMEGNINSESETSDLDRLFGATRLFGGTLATANAGADGTAFTTTFNDIAFQAAFFTTVEVVDSLGSLHTVNFYFFKDDSAANTWEVRAYVNSNDVDAAATFRGDKPRLLGRTSIFFQSTGERTAPVSADIAITNIAWNSGAATTQDIDVRIYPFTQHAAESIVCSLSQDGESGNGIEDSDVGSCSE